MIDVSLFMKLAVGAASLIITGAVPIIVPVVLSHLKVSKNSALAGLLSNAVASVAQLAIGELTSIGGHNTTLDVRNKAIANAITKLSPALQAGLTTLGITPDVLAQHALGEISKVLGTAPTSVAAPAPIPAAPKT